MARFLALLAAAPLMLNSVSSHAIYKCEENGKIAYSEEKCSTGKASAIDTTNSRLSQSSADEAKMRSKREKESVHKLEEARRQDELRDERARQKAMRASEALQKKCHALALKAKWSEEEAASAIGKAADKSKRTAARNRENHEAQCGKR